jgi:hypothetical protein
LPRNMLSLDFMMTSIEISSVKNCPALVPSARRAGYPSGNDG